MLVTLAVARPLVDIQFFDLRDRPHMRRSLGILDGLVSVTARAWRLATPDHASRSARPAAIVDNVSAIADNVSCVRRIRRRSKQHADMQRAIRERRSTTAEDRAGSRQRLDAWENEGGATVPIHVGATK